MLQKQGLLANYFFRGFETIEKSIRIYKMTSTVTPINQPQTTAIKAPAKVTRTSIFYINDVHSNLSNMERIKSISDDFDDFVPSEPTDKLKLSAGDIGVGRDVPLNKLSVTFQNLIGIMANACGNHEFDLNKKDLADVLKDAKYKFLGMNVDFPENNPINKELRKDITGSYIQEQNGTKYGVIGLMPFDFVLHLSDPERYQDFDIKSVEETIVDLQKKVDELKEQGVDKVIILSHGGYTADVALAQNVEGIDVILGGHTHDLLKGIEEGKNLFYSKKTGEPTIIVQAGKNGNHAGILNLEFDEKGVIRKAQNNIIDTEKFPRSPVMKFFADRILGKPEVVGTIKSAPKVKLSLVTESSSANFVADAERSELGVDLVLINAGNIRSSLEEGPLTTRDLQMLTPFDNKAWIIKLTEKQLVDALKVGAKSMASVDNTPGIIYASGLKYTISKSGELKAATFVDRDGKETPIDINNPNHFKTYTVATDDFIAKGGNGFITNKEHENAVIEKFDFDKNKLVVDYLKKHPEPVVISPEKRITIVD